MVQQHQEIQMLEARIIDRAKKTTTALAIIVTVACGIVEIALFLMQILSPGIAALLFLLTSSIFPLVAFWILPWISDVERFKQYWTNEAPNYVPGRDD